MDIDYSIKRPSCKNSNDGKITIYIANNSGKVYINWINMPKNSLLSSGARVLDNIPAGQYIVEIEDDINFGQNKKKLVINIPDQDELKFDFVKIDQPICEDDYGAIDVFWSGGVAPYKIRCSTLEYSSLNNSLTIDKLKPSTVDLVLEDSLGCFVEYSNIIIHHKKINLDIQYIPIKKYGAPCEEFRVIVDGQSDPSKIVLINNTNHTIIPIKEKLLKNFIYSGSYTLKIIDNNGCEKELSFYVSEPKPLTAKCSVRADYSFNSYFSYEPIIKIYDTIILPKAFSKIKDINISDKIFLLDKKQQKIHQIIISEPTKIKLFSEEYYMLHIATGIPISNNLNTKYKLTIQDNELDCLVGLDKRNKNKDCARLILTNLCLNNNMKYKFNNNDTIEIKINNNLFTTKLLNIELLNNIYNANSITSILNIDVNDYDTLYSINRSLISDSLSVRSLTQKKIQTKGSVYLNIFGGVTFPSGVNIDGYKYKITLLNKNNEIIKTFFTNDYVHITDLDMGDYYIDIRDIGNNGINYFNNNIVYGENISIYIPGSAEGELSIMNIDLVNKHIEKSKKDPEGIRKFFRNTNSPSIIFSFPETKKIHIKGPNNLNKDIFAKYTKLSNLQTGTYTITDGDKTKSIVLFPNSNRIVNKL